MSLANQFNKSKKGNGNPDLGKGILALAARLINEREEKGPSIMAKPVVIDGSFCLLTGRILRPSTKEAVPSP